ncbi:stability/partitioning determinant [Pseudomonas sp. SWRI74]|uniref:Stability/partitioning determinant n=1 Tax=Pseudomonas azerbaijanoccidentalis TaxID=2842347 RepID=A0ABS6QZD9_9PSED|nr:stability/partitioning determinant [Pseudomonas azerbaijanoccidentalis]MBV4524302.1 stability/partitioning determinant [Pseudomonas azerbaijanoccidentalis]
MSADQVKEPTEAANAFAILGDFKAKAPASAATATVTKEIEKDIQQVAADNGFHSREAKPVNAAKARRFNAAEPKKQLNIKIPVPMHERYYRMASERGINVLHELLGDALDALEELEALKAANEKRE